LAYLLFKEEINHGKRASSVRDVFGLPQPFLRQNATALKKISGENTITILRNTFVMESYKAQGGKFLCLKVGNYCGVAWWQSGL